METASADLVGDTMTGGYGAGPDILHDCTIAVNPGEIAVIVGPNGAGKSTAMKAVFGMLNLRQGSVRLDGEDITGLSPQDRVARGMGFVPQNNNIFTSMTVEENLEMGAFIRRDDFSGTMAQVYDLFPALKARQNNMGNQLSGGEQQMLAIARALMTNPGLVILDEATEGLAPLIRVEIWRVLEQLKSQNQSILVIDKNVDALTRIADRHYIIEKGVVVWSGDSAALKADEELQHRYLGV